MYGLLDAPRQDLTETLVTSAYRSLSPRTTFRVDVLNLDLSETGDTLPVIVDAGGSVDYAFRADDLLTDAQPTDAAAVRLTAAVTIGGSVSDGDLLSHLFRVVTIFTADDGTDVEFYLGTFASTLPGLADTGTVASRTLTLAAREYLWNARVTEDWETVDANVDVFASIRADLLDVFGVDGDRLPLFAQESASLTGSLDFPPSTPYLQKWSATLGAIGYDAVTTTPDGLPTTQFLADLANKGPEETYAPSQGRIVVAGTVEPLDPAMPNVVRVENSEHDPDVDGTAAEGNGWVTIRNQSTGPALIDQRGYEVFRGMAIPAAGQTELVSYATGVRQRLFAGGLQFTGHVGLNPLHGDRDTVTLTRPRLGLSGLWDVTGWSFPVGRVDSEDAALMTVVAEARVT